MKASIVPRILYPVAGAALLVAVWHFSVVQFRLPYVLLPSPMQVLDAAIDQRAVLLSQGWVTLKECLYGFALAFALGVPIAVAVAGSRVLNLMFSPLLIAMQSVPKVALAPMVLVWAGTGIESKLVIAWLVAFFPIVVDTAAGLRATPRELLELAHSLRASRWQTFAKVQFPAAVPFVMAGSKVAVTLAVIGAVIGEFVGSNEGLGNLLLVANSQMSTALAFAALFALAALGIALYGAVALLERALDAWSGEPPLLH
ncbi:MAG: ABC transporter permease [Candidatus Levyibacteriota bacterium]